MQSFFLFFFYLVVKDDTFRKQALRGCEFWFDCRTGIAGSFVFNLFCFAVLRTILCCFFWISMVFSDVLEEHFLNERYCEQVWRILNEKKQDVVIVELHKDSLSLLNDTASSGSGGDSHDIIGSSDSVRDFKFDLICFF